MSFHVNEHFKNINLPLTLTIFRALEKKIQKNIYQNMNIQKSPALINIRLLFIILCKNIVILVFL